MVKYIESGQNPNQVQRDMKLIRPLRQFSSGILSLSLSLCTYTHILNIFDKIYLGRSSVFSEPSLC